MLQPPHNLRVAHGRNLEYLLFMPLIPAPLPNDLITLQNGGAEAVLNRQRYPEFQGVQGEPTYSHNKPQDAMREAFAALKVAAKRASSGNRQQIYLGDPAIELLYGRANKKKDEQDCDVVGYVLQGGSYGYVLGEGKGADVLKAKKQLDAALDLIRARKTDPGPVFGAVLVTNRLRYLEWNEVRKQWVAYVNNSEEQHITARLQQNVRIARPTLQQDRVYLLDGSDDGLPVWNIVRGPQPFTIYIHDRRPGTERGTFRPLSFGAGTIELHYMS